MLIELAASAMVRSDEPVDVRAVGAFGFPQDRARVLCDTAELRLSAVSDAEHLFVQAVLWEDGDGTVGLTDDGRPIGDWSSLVLDVDCDGEASARVDRSYALNPWPTLAGLHYSVSLGGGGSTGLQGDSKGRGSINYVGTSDGWTVRVECFVIPLSEIGLEGGASLRLAYWGSSPEPSLTVNSVGFERDRAYYPHHLPRASFHEVVLGEHGETIDVQGVPEGRDTIERMLREPVAVPRVGERPPEVVASSWQNWEGAGPTLEGLRGKVVVVEFWATWCGPCVAGIPHLNELHDRYGNEGLVIVSLTDQARVGAVERLVDELDMRYVVGFGSETADAYGVTGIPHAFVVGRDGVLRWEGHPASDGFEAAIEAALRDE